MSETEVEQEIDPLEEWITRNPDRSVTLRLGEPVDVASTVTSELRLRRPKAKDLRMIQASEQEGSSGLNFGAALDLGAKLAGVSPAVVDELDIPDAMRLAEVIGGFFASSPGPTQTS